MQPQSATLNKHSRNLLVFFPFFLHPQREIPVDLGASRFLVLPKESPGELLAVSAELLGGFLALGF